MICDEHGQCIEFDIAREYKKIVVNLSGGADSAILLLMLCSYLQKNNRYDTTVSTLTLSLKSKHNWQPIKAAEIIEYVMYKLKYFNFVQHHVIYGDLFDDAVLHKYQKQLFDRGEMDLLIGACTANPDFDTSIEMADGRLINISKDCAEPLKVRNSYVDELIFRDGYTYFNPFANVDKRFVASMYKQYNAMDLLPLTRTCSRKNIEDYTPDFKHTPCGMCWSCAERKFAFGSFE